MKRGMLYLLAIMVGLLLMPSIATAKTKVNAINVAVVADVSENGAQAAPDAQVILTRANKPVSTGPAPFSAEPKKYGTYVVSLDQLPEGAKITGILVNGKAVSKARLVLSASKKTYNVTFQVYTPSVTPPSEGGSVGIKVFKDLNQDGFQDAGEGPLGGVQVTVAGVTQITDDEYGALWFGPLSEGWWTAYFTPPAGWYGPTFQPFYIFGDGGHGDLWIPFHQ